MAPLVGQFELAHPARLLALILMPLLLYSAWRTATMMLPWQRVLSSVCRVAVFALIVLAWAGPANRWQSSQQTVVIVSDVSLSVSAAFDTARRFMDDAAKHQADHDLQILFFAGKPAEAVAEIDEKQLAFGSLARGESAPADALLLAAGLLPPDRVGKILLATDARQTKGDLLAAAQGVHVPVHVLPLEPFARPEVAMESVIAPRHARPGEPFEIEAVVASNRQTRAAVRLDRNGEEIEKVEEDLNVGGNTIRFRTSLSDEARTVFTVNVTATDDGVPKNNSRRAVVVAHGRPKALCIAANAASAQPLREALNAAGFDVGPATRPGEVRWRNEVLGQNDLVLLLDVPASSISQDAAEALAVYVRGGGGLVVTGGKTMFEAEAFQACPAEPLMPVKPLKRREERRPVLALVLVIDKSESMEKEDRLKLAKQAAQKTVGVLANEDKLGVIVFGDEVLWITELATLADRRLVAEQIDGIKAGGFTNMYPALQRALVALEQADADRRALIVLTDGVPLPGEFNRVAQAMADARIMVSTVTVGDGADQTIMKDIATLSGGESHHCKDPNEVPRILQKIAKDAVAPPTVAEFRPFILRKLPGLNVGDAPPLVGYAATSPKPRSEVLLVTAEGDPLLTWWRYGQGVVVAATSPAVAGDRWRSWSGYRSFWTQLARHAVRPKKSTRAHVRLLETTGGISAEVDARAPDGGFANRARVETRLANDGGDRREFVLPQVAPGRYRREFDLETPGIYDFEFTLGRSADMSGVVRRTASLDYPAELQLGDVNESLLESVARLTGGTYDPSPAEVFADDGRRVERVDTWWTYLIAAALILFVVDVALRRMRFSPKGARD